MVLRTHLGVFLVAALSLAGCKNDGGNNNTDPDAGGDADTGECPDGSLGCACYSNNTCDMLDGEPLACIDSVCVVEDTPDPGELNAACAGDDECGEYDGMTLRCVSEMCQVPNCLSGATNCPCAPAGSCDAAGASCQDDVCRLDDCEPGTAGCECTAAGTCMGDLQCLGGFCESGVGVYVAVGDADARSCEIVLHDPRDLVTNVSFDASVRGQWEGRGDRVALAFHAGSDGAIADGSVTLTLASAEESDIATIEVIVGECFNADGATIAGALPTIAR